MHHDAMDRARHPDDVAAVDRHDRVVGQRGLVSRERRGVLARIAVEAADQHDLVHDHRIGVGVVRTRTPARRAIDRVAAPGELERRGIGHGLRHAAALRRVVLADQHLVVGERQHPHVDVLGRVVALRERIEQRHVEAFPRAEIGEDVRLVEARVLVRDQSRHERVAIAEQVEIAAPMHQRDLVDRFVPLRSDRERHEVVVRPRTVVFVVDDRARAAVLHEARAVVADPHAVGSGRDEMHAREVRAAALQHVARRVFLGDAVDDDPHVRWRIGGRQRHHHRGVQRIEVAPADHDAGVAFVLGDRAQWATRRDGAAQSP